MTFKVAAAVVGAILVGSAGASTTTGTIAQIAINRQYGNVVFVRMDPQPSPAEVCGTNTSWSYVFPVTTDLDKKMFAMLDGAQLAGRTVTITGTGTCTDFGGIESGVMVLVN